MEEKVKKQTNRNKVFFIVALLFICVIAGIIAFTQKEVQIKRMQGIISEYKEVNSINWDLTKVDIVYDTEGIAVPVPKGYVASNADGEHTVNTGFVIYEGEKEVTTSNAWEESKTRNQWVWVPVNDPNRIYEETSGVKKAKLYDYLLTGRRSRTNSNYEPGTLTSYDREYHFSRYGFQGLTRDKLYQELQVEFDKTIESIKKYGGFYIGRYETGNVSSKAPVVQRMNTIISSQTWYAMYNKMKYLGVNTNVKANMIWGSLWDETLQWLVDSGNKTYGEIASSTSWGNYNDATFTYTTTTGGTATKNSGSGIIIPSGSTEYTKANNIYDMAGNVRDWTLEAYGPYGRYDRGGVYSSYSSASDRSYYNPTYINTYFGSRAYFYIK